MAWQVYECTSNQEPTMAIKIILPIEYAKMELSFHQLASIWINIWQPVYPTSCQIYTSWQASSNHQRSLISALKSWNNVGMCRNDLIWLESVALILWYNYSVKIALAADKHCILDMSVMVAPIAMKRAHVHNCHTNIFTLLPYQIYWYW